MLNTKIVEKRFLGRDTLPAFVLITNSFSWYFPLYIFLTNALDKLEIAYEDLLIIFGFHYMAVLTFAFIGVTMTEKVFSRSSLLSIWVFLGIIFSPLIILLKDNSMLSVYLVPLLIGIALGFGFPNCLAYFADSVDIENRGKLGGIALFTALLGMFLVGFLTSVLGFVESVLVLTLWRVWGAAFFQITKNRKGNTKKEIMKTSYHRIISERPFILYMVPWVMFCLVNFFEYPLQQYHWGIETSSTVSTVEFGIASLAALIGGCFADVAGRKRLVILGYVLLGTGYATLSIFPENYISISIYAFFDGIAWGLFALIFFAVIWGDLANNKVKDKYYLLGTLPFLLSSYISVIVAPFAKLIDISTSFSLASFFLFLAVVPLMYAPETLPERKLREKELRGYIEKAKKIREKFT
ncbi:MAG: MFS transporter [Candidatus Bathyarchaeia archaeon]